MLTIIVLPHPRRLAGHWPRFTRVGVLACSERVNSPVCSQQEIAGYPTVKVGQVCAPISE